MRHTETETDRKPNRQTELSILPAFSVRTSDRKQHRIAYLHGDARRAEIRIRRTAHQLLDALLEPFRVEVAQALRVKHLLMGGSVDRGWGGGGGGGRGGVGLWVGCQ